MSETIRTPRKVTKGLGAAKEGVNHWIAQRVTAIALVVLVPVLLVQLMGAYGGGYDAARAWIGAPINAILLILFVSAAFYHMRLGLQVVVEDYITKPAAKVILLLINTFFAGGAWVVAVFAILKTALAAG